MIFCKDEEIKIWSDVCPDVGVRVIEPDDTPEERADKKKKPYINKVDFNLFIEYKEEEYRLFIPKNYTWDGASIPFLFRPLIGKKGALEFLLPSKVHDKMCECKWLVKNDRYLSSLIFKKLLLACGVGKFRAQIMFLAVDNFQKLQGWG